MDDFGAPMMDDSPSLSFDTLSSMHLVQVHAGTGISPSQLSLGGGLVSSRFEVAFPSYSHSLSDNSETRGLGVIIYGCYSLGPYAIPITGTSSY